jgi:F-type H+-transporting ATPase subunit delta
MPLIETQPDAAARVYAKSLFELASTQGGRGKIEEVLGELEEILDLARSDARFGEFLASRSVGTGAREASLTRIFKGRVTDLTLNFLLVLNDKGRIAALPAIVAAFDSRVQEQFGRVEVDVFTASPMDSGAAAGLKGRLSEVLGKEVVLHPYTEPSMIGGVKLRIGDRLVDGSVATRLRKMKDLLDDRGSAALRARIGKIIEG